MQARSKRRFERAGGTSSRFLSVSEERSRRNSITDRDGVRRRQVVGLLCNCKPGRALGNWQNSNATRSAKESSRASPPLVPGAGRVRAKHGSVRQIIQNRNAPFNPESHKLQFCLSCVVKQLDIGQASCCRSAMELDDSEVLALLHASREQAAAVHLDAAEVQESMRRTLETIRTTDNRIRKSQEFLCRTDQLLEGIRRVY